MKITKKVVTHKTTGHMDLHIEALRQAIEQVPPLLALFQFLNGDDVTVTRVAIHDPRLNYLYRWYDGEQRSASTDGVKFLQLWPSPPVDLHDITSYDFIRRKPSSDYTVLPADVIDSYRGFLRRVTTSAVQYTHDDYPYVKGADVAHVEASASQSSPEFGTPGGHAYVDYSHTAGWVDPLLPSVYSTGFVSRRKDAEIFLEFSVPHNGKDVLIPAVFVVRRSDLPSSMDPWGDRWTSRALTHGEVLAFLRQISSKHTSRRRLSSYVPYIKLPGLFLWATTGPIFRTAELAMGATTEVYTGIELPPPGELYMYEHHTVIQTKYSLYNDEDPRSWMDTVIALALDVTPEDYIPGTEVDTETVNNGVRITTYKPPVRPTRRCCIANLDQPNATGVTGYFCVTPESLNSLSYAIDPGTMSRLTNMMEST